MKNFLKNNRAASLVGYAFMVGFIGLIIVAPTENITAKIKTLINIMSNNYSTVSDPLVNNAPTYSGTITVPTLTQNTLMTPYAVTGFIDPDGNTLTYTALGTWPAGISLLKIDNTTVNITGTPTVSGTFAGLSIEASDGSLSVTTASFSITIDPPDPCASSPSIGTVCNDGSVYAGLTPDGSIAMYVTRCDAGQTHNGTSCTGTRNTMAWNDGSSNYLNSTLADCNIAVPTAPCDTGESNTNTLFTADSSTVAGTQNHIAADYCYNLNQHSQTDWYLPSAHEVNDVMRANYAAIGGFMADDTAASRYWSSSEENRAQYAYHPRFPSSDYLTSINKDANLNVRCARK